MKTNKNIMIGLLSALTISGSLVAILLPTIQAYRKYRLKEQTEKEFFLALEDRIKSYITCYENINMLGEEQFFPLLDKMENEITFPLLEELLNIQYTFYLNFNNLADDIIAFAEGCSSLTKYNDFMENLSSTNRVLYRFVITMKNSLNKRKQFSINDDFIVFLNMHKNEIYKAFDEKEIEELTDKVKKYIDLLNKDLSSSEKYYRSKRKLLKTLNEIRDIIKKINKKINVPKKLVKDVRKYVPIKLLPLIIIFEEITEKAEREKSKYDKRKLRAR